MTLTVRCSAPKVLVPAPQRGDLVIARNRLQGTQRRLADLAAHDTTPQEVLRLLLRPAARVHHRLLPLPPPLWHEHRLRLLRTPSKPGPRPLLLRGASRLAPTVLPPVLPLARHLLRIAPSGSLHAKKRAYEAHCPPSQHIITRPPTPPNPNPNPNQDLSLEYREEYNDCYGKDVCVCVDDQGEDKPCVFTDFESQVDAAPHPNPDPNPNPTTLTLTPQP